MKRFFDPNSFLWRGFGKVADFFGLSICWMLCCLPVLTLFPSCIALYDSIAHALVLGDDPQCYQRFFRTFRNELKRGIGLSALWLGIGLVFSLLFQLAIQLMPRSLEAAVSVGCLALAAIPVCIVIWLIPIQSRFVYSFARLHSTAAAFVVTQLPATAAVLAIFTAGLVAHFYLPFLVMFLPALMVWGQSWFIERVFRRCTAEDPST